jgi:hypothetical protein
MAISPGHLTRLQGQTVQIGRSKQYFHLFFVAAQGMLGETARRKDNMLQSKSFRAVPPLPKILIFRIAAHRFNHFLIL